MTRTRTAFIISMFVIAALIAVAPASAQDWRGTGHLTGTVKDESGQPLEGVAVKVTIPSRGNGGTQTKTNKKGQWSIAGLAAGNWNVDFQKEGYDPHHVTDVPVAGAGVGSQRPIEVVMKKATAATDPNIEIRESLVKAAGLMNNKQFGDALAIYQNLYQKYPQAVQLLPLIARAYYGQGNTDKAIEYLRAALEKDPNNNEVKILLGNVLIEKGSPEEGRQILASVDESKITSPDTWVNVGIALLNQNKPAEAMTYFTKAIAKFPQAGDAYYYRALAELQQGQNPAAKTDLEKFIQISPNAPEAENAKKILEQLK